MLEVCFDRARGGLRPCSRCVSTVLELFFDRRSRYVSTVARNMHQPCSSNAYVNARDMLRPSTKYVCFDRARVMFSTIHEVFSTVLELCFDRARGLFRPGSKWVVIMLEIGFNHA